MSNWAAKKEPISRPLKFGATDVSVTNSKGINVRQNRAIRTDIVNPTVLEVFQQLQVVTNVVVEFLRQFKSEKSNVVRKKVINNPKVRNFILVYCVKILGILANVLRNRNIKDRLYTLQLQSLDSVHADYSIEPICLVGEDVKLRINQLANAIVSEIVLIKGVLENCLIMLNMARSVNLNELVGKCVAYNRKPYSLSHYYGFVQTNGQTLFHCCLICGEKVLDSKIDIGKSEIDIGNSKGFVNPKIDTGNSKGFVNPKINACGNSKVFVNPKLSACGNSYHRDCYVWWENRGIFQKTTKQVVQKDLLIM